MVSAVLMVLCEVVKLHTRSHRLLNFYHTPLTLCHRIHSPQNVSGLHYEQAPVTHCLCSAINVGV